MQWTPRPRGLRSINASDNDDAMEQPAPILIQATARADIATARRLFEEYAAWLKVDLCFQDFDRELATLPGHYAPPAGRLLLAMIDGRVAGCVALRPLEREVCELKRMWVRPEFRGLEIGRKLAEEVIAQARSIVLADGTRYARMRLDTLAWMTAAIALYHSLGFREIRPYRYNPQPDAVFMELELR
jgi:putative acetyltransferase